MAGNGFGGMKIIALFHLLWLLLFPLGLFYCIRGLKKRGFLIAGFILIVLSLPALWLIRVFWPFDYLFPSKPRILAAVEYSAWKVTLTQTPDADFYHTDFKVISPKGRTNWIVYDADDSKWWRAESKITSNRIYFFRSSATSDKSPSYLDLERKIFWSGYYERQESLTDAPETLEEQNDLPHPDPLPKEREHL